MKRISYISLLVAGSLVIFGSCSRGNNPGMEYAPDMADSKGYEPYNQKDSAPFNPYGMNMREPVKGSVAVGQKDYYYPYDNTAEGYAAAGASWTYPAGFKDSAGRGKYMYDIYCTPCHGKEGGNDGAVFAGGALGKPAWANYQDPIIRDMPVGMIYHTLTYGKNNMGSHASVLSPYDRWCVIKYVKELSYRGSGMEAPAAAPSDSTAAKK